MQMWQYIYNVIASVKVNGNMVTRHEFFFILEYLTFYKKKLTKLSTQKQGRSIN
jgi:hypothetical protein